VIGLIVWAMVIDNLLRGVVPVNRRLHPGRRERRTRC
jgi:hypothetical protein